MKPNVLLRLLQSLGRIAAGLFVKNRQSRKVAQGIDQAVDTIITTVEGSQDPEKPPEKPGT